MDLLKISPQQFCAIFGDLAHPWRHRPECLGSGWRSEEVAHADFHGCFHAQAIVGARQAAAWSNINTRFRGEKSADLGFDVRAVTIRAFVIEPVADFDKAVNL